MNDDREIRKQQAQDIQNDLSNGGLSRRALLNRLKVLGVGFGAAYMLGIKDADAEARSDTMVNLKSTDPALNDIIEESRRNVPSAGEDSGVRTAAQEYPPGYRRVYARVYKKGYAKLYGREYKKGYAKLYGREYKKGYAKLYGREYKKVYKKGYAKVYGREYKKGYPRVYARVYRRVNAPY